MSSGVERYDITITQHSSPEHSLGGPCSKCGDHVTRTYYSDVEIMGQRRAIVLETCHCDMQRDMLRHNISDA